MMLMIILFVYSTVAIVGLAVLFAWLDHKKTNERIMSEHDYEAMRRKVEEVIKRLHEEEMKRERERQKTGK